MFVSTTEFAPILTLFPTVTSPRIHEPAPITTLFPIIGAEYSSPFTFAPSVTFWKIVTLSPITTAGPITTPSPWCGSLKLFPSVMLKTVLQL